MRSRRCSMPSSRLPSSPPDAKMGTLRLFDATTQSLRIVAHSGFQRAFLDYFAVVRDAEDVWSQAQKERRRVIVEDVRKSAWFAGTACPRGHGGGRGACRSSNAARGARRPFARSDRDSLDPSTSPRCAHPPDPRPSGPRGSGPHRTSTARGGAATRPIEPRTSSWRCWATSCAIRYRLS